MKPITLFFLFVVLLPVTACDRKPKPPERIGGPPHEPVTVVAVGDMLLADAVQSRLERFGYDYPFKYVKPLLEGDVVIGNMEGAVTTHPEVYDKTKSWSYKCDPAAAKAIAEAGFTHMDLANNHTYDYGLQGLKDTIAHLEAAGLKTFGAGLNEGQARRGTVAEVNGIRIGMLGYMHSRAMYRLSGVYADEEEAGIARIERDDIIEDIARMRQTCDTVLVFFHWGRNYKGIKDEQVEYGKLAIQAGADAVIGHGPHMVQGMEVIDGVPLLYSVGNFTFGTPGRFKRVEEWQRHGLVAKLKIVDRRVQEVELIPIATDNKDRKVRFRPRPVDSRTAEEILSRMQEGLAPRLRLKEAGHGLGVWRAKAAVGDSGRD